MRRMAASAAYDGGEEGPPVDSREPPAKVYPFWRLFLMAGAVPDPSWRVLGARAAPKITVLLSVQIMLCYVIFETEKNRSQYSSDLADGNCQVKSGVGTRMLEGNILSIGDSRTSSLAKKRL
jgi:hypothetical protein